MKRLTKIKQNRILVIGDVMLDTYYLGSANRISPEAPVPVFNFDSEYSVLGGAGNVAANLAAINQRISVMAVIGDDAKGEKTLELFKEKGVNSEFIIKDTDRPTTVKIRILGQNNHQMIRLDSESIGNINFEIEKKLIAKFEENVKSFDIVMISDYLKGLLTPTFLKDIIEIANRNSIKVIIDIKDMNADKYYGAYLLKPNRKELQDITGIKCYNLQQVTVAANKLLEQTQVYACLVTLGAEGMMYFNRDGEVFNVDALESEVFDVTGAGDTTFAYLGACMASGLDIVDAIEIANAAAGCKVVKTGTSTVTLEEVEIKLRNLETESKPFGEQKIYDVDELVQRLALLKNKKIVFTNGCFDILHVGHIRYLEQAKKEGDVLVVAVNSDISVKMLKGSTRPIVPEEERIEMLASLECVDYVFCFSEETPYEAINKIKPHVLVKGGDYKPDEVVGKDIVESYGGKLVLINYVEGKSTTNIIQKIADSIEVPE